jgi:transposase
VTRKLIWEEEFEDVEGAYSYTRFCELYREWVGALDITMRGTYKAGRKLFVDWAGHTMEITDPETGEITESPIFVATIGASNYTYVEAATSEQLPEWIGAHVRAFAFFGGVPEIVIPDNLKTGVQKPSFYDPDLNPTYEKMAEHYGLAVIPTRICRPQDKAKVEAAVRLVEERILAPLRNRTFFSVDELNEAIAPLLDALLERPFQELPGNRKTYFAETDEPALRPLPTSPFAPQLWKKVRPGIDYHVQIDGHYYSVPYGYRKKELEACITGSTIELFHNGERIASHRRSVREYGHTTISAHMPEAHREYAEWNPDRFIAWARTTGSATAELIGTLLEKHTHPEQAYRRCAGIMSLARRYEDGRVEAACRWALSVGAISYKSVKSILEKNLDGQPLPEQLPNRIPIKHPHIRGPQYYN